MGRPKGSNNKSSGPVASTLQPVPPPNPIKNATNHNVQWGLPVNPVGRLKLMEPGEWEEFVREWVESLKKEYHDVQRLGGSGDEGRDVVGYLSDKADPWDNYQCKHYRDALTPGDAILELGKLCHYTFIGSYNLPRHYYFVAPKGVGTRLAKLIDKPDDIRKELISGWSKKCEEKITGVKPIKLEGSFLKYVESFDFSIIQRISPGKIIEQHQKTRYYVLRFGGGLPPRPDPDKPPADIASKEARYVTQLVDAYSEHVGKAVTSIDDLADRSDLVDHFQRCREHFYCAESLRNFSRELLPDNEFSRLQDDIYDGVIDTCQDTHCDGYARVRATVKAANELQLTSHTLISCTRPRDLSGICHQLANDDRLKWVRKP